MFCFQPGLSRDIFTRDVYAMSIMYAILDFDSSMVFHLSSDIALMTLQLAYMEGCIKHCKEEIWYKKGGGSAKKVHGAFLVLL